MQKIHVETGVEREPVPVCCSGPSRGLCQRKGAEVQNLGEKFQQHFVSLLAGTTVLPFQAFASRVR